MLTTIEAEIDVNGSVTFLEPLKINKKSRAIITLLDDEKPRKSQQNENAAIDATDANARQLEWLKANRDKYAGKYVALDGDVLLAHAEKMKELKEKLRESEKENIFIVKVFAEETMLPAGL